MTGETPPAAKGVTEEMVEAAYDAFTRSFASKPIGCNNTRDDLRAALLASLSVPEGEAIRDQTISDCALAVWKELSGTPAYADAMHLAERAVRALRVSPAAPELAVKDLEWTDCEPGHTNGHNGRRIVEKALMPFGAYFIEHNQDDDTWWLVDGLVGPVIAGSFNEAWEARAAAQDIFNAAILSALASPQQGEKA